MAFLRFRRRGRRDDLTGRCRQMLHRAGREHSSNYREARDCHVSEDMLPIVELFHDALSFGELARLVEESFLTTPYKIRGNNILVENGSECVR